MTIVLCGYMGCGKSLIGKKLAKKMKWPFFDLDEEIEKKQKLSIPEIFSQKGEILFRKVETEVLKAQLANDEDRVLALGGGTPCYGNNLEIIKQTSDAVLVYLKMNLEALTHRLFEERFTRPLIANLTNKEELQDFIRKHLFERQFYYFQSDFNVDCSSAIPDEIVAKILQKTG